MARREFGTIYVERIIDEEPDLSYLKQDYADCSADEAPKYRAQDKARLASYGNFWWCVGVRARVDFVVKGTVQTLFSSGLWGIESDSGDDYFDDVAAEQVAELRDICAELGVTVNAAWEWVE